jgi:hypothetical protein
MAKRKKAVRYRDSLTGHFVSKETYKRSKAHNGTRYVRSYVASKGQGKRKAQRPLPPAFVPTVRPAALVKTWFVTLIYTNTRGTRTFDFFVRARKRDNVMKYILRFAKTQQRLAFEQDDPRAKSVVEYLASFGWTEKKIAEIPRGEFPEYDEKPEGFVAYQ